MMIELKSCYKKVCFTRSQKTTSVYVSLSFRKKFISECLNLFNKTKQNKIKQKDLKSVLLIADHQAAARTSFPSFLLPASPLFLSNLTHSTLYLSVPNIYTLKEYVLLEEDVPWPLLSCS